MATAQLLRHKLCASVINSLAGVQTNDFFGALGLIA
jgi:hypothetical protein